MSQKARFLIKATIAIVVVFSLITLPVVALAKIFDGTNFPTDSVYEGSRLDINRTVVSVNQTIRVKLSLRIDGDSKKAPAGLPEYITVFLVEEGNVVGYKVFPENTTNASGKARWTFKARDLGFTFKPGYEYQLKIVCRNYYYYNENYNETLDYSSANTGDYGYVYVAIRFR
jgi:hypothetical protein